MSEIGTKKIAFIAISEPRRTSSMLSERNEQTGLYIDGISSTHSEAATRQAARIETRGSLRERRPPRT
jgi:hypothetical protein